jgi:N-acetylglutamate synthase-like GNAT family acetyltransferase
MISEIKIRKAKIEDFNELWPLIKQLWPDLKVTRSNIKEFFLKDIKKNKYVVAEKKQKIIGFGVLSFRGMLYYGETVAYIEALIVDEKHRGRGIGKQIVDALIKEAKKKNCKVLEVDSGLQRKGAHKFYEAIGFKKADILFIEEI